MQGWLLAIICQNWMIFFFVNSSKTFCSIRPVPDWMASHFLQPLWVLALAMLMLPLQPLKAHVLLEESTFDTRAQALAAAKYLNCKGVRKIDDRWKPCDRPFPPSHDQ